MQQQKKKKKKKRIPNYPRIIGWSMALLLVICVIVFVLRLHKWNQGVPYIMTPEDYEKIKLDTNDNIILMPPTVLNPDSENYDGTTDVLIFGNDSYFEGTDSQTGVIDYLKTEIPNVNFYNCCLPGSYQTSFNVEETSPEECPEDYFTLFWLVLELRWSDFSKQHEALSYLDSDKYDIERYREVLGILENIDLSKIDVVMFCYDGNDYLEGHLPINFIGEDAQTENPTSILGSLYQSIYLLNYVNPDIQFVYACPIFCYADNADGKKESCAIVDTGNGTIAETFNAARYVTNYYGLSYIDMYCGVLINEENAKQYLENDGITPNKKARRMMADRLIFLLKERF